MLAASGCGRGAGGDPGEFPGPYLVIDRVQLSTPDRTLILARSGSNWRIEGTPFLVDDAAAAALETTFRSQWTPIEVRRIAHTSSALGLDRDDCIELTVWPTDENPVHVRLGREDADTGARWVLPEHAEAAGLVREPLGFSADPLGWRSDRACGLTAGDVRNVMLDGTLIATRDDREWHGDGVDSYRVERLVRQLAGLDGEPIPSSDTAANALVLFEISTPEMSCAIGVHEPREGDFRIAVDGTIGFRIEGHEARSLLDAERSLGPRERLALVSESLAHAEIRGIAPLSLGIDGRWFAVGSESATLDCDRYVRAVCRLDALHDAPESAIAFALPRRTVRLGVAGAERLVEFVWQGEEGEVFARIDRGTPFRVEPACDRVLRSDPCIDPG